MKSYLNFLGIKKAFEKIFKLLSKNLEEMRINLKLRTILRSFTFLAFLASLIVSLILADIWLINSFFVKFLSSRFLLDDLNHQELIFNIDPQKIWRVLKTILKLIITCAFWLTIFPFWLIKTVRENGDISIEAYLSAISFIIIFLGVIETFGWILLVTD